jgi:hypothetical protein
MNAVIEITHYGANVTYVRETPPSAHGSPGPSPASHQKVECCGEVGSR